MTDETTAGQQPAPTGGDSAEPAGAETPDAVRRDPAFQQAMQAPRESAQYKEALHRLTAAYHAESGEQVPQELAPDTPSGHGDTVDRAAREALAPEQPEPAAGQDGETGTEVDQGAVDHMAFRLSTHAGGPPVFDDTETAQAVAGVALQAGFTETDVRRVAAEVGQQMDADGARAALTRWLGSEAEADRAVQTAREVLKSMPKQVREFISANEATIGNSPSVILALARRKL